MSPRREGLSFHSSTSDPADGVPAVYSLAGLSSADRILGCAAGGNAPGRQEGSQGSKVRDCHDTDETYVSVYTTLLTAVYSSIPDHADSHLFLLLKAVYSKHLVATRGRKGRR